MQPRDSRRSPLGAGAARVGGKYQAAQLRLPRGSGPLVATVRKNREAWFLAGILEGHSVARRNAPYPRVQSAQISPDLPQSTQPQIPNSRRNVEIRLGQHHIDR